MKPEQEDKLFNVIKDLQKAVINLQKAVVFNQDRLKNLEDHHDVDEEEEDKSLKSLEEMKNDIKAS